MTIDLRKLKTYWTAKNIAIGLAVLALIGIFGAAAWSALRPPPVDIQDEPAATLPLTATVIPTSTPIPEPSPTPIAVHHLAWTNRETGIYLREAPGNTTILAAIPNGEEITIVGGQSTIKGGLKWIEASYQVQSGWAATQYLFIIEGDYQRIGEDGRWLYREINGSIDSYLWPGSPYQILQSMTDEDDNTWQEIRLPDDSTGWIKEQG